MKRLGLMLARRAGLTSAARHLNRHSLLVVCYHGVTSERTSDDWLLLPLSDFEKQLVHLTRHFRLVSIDEGLRLLRAGKLDEPTACITFDDGYANNLTEALPVLRRHDAPATVYLVTEFVGTNRRLWTTRVEYAVRDAAVSQLSIGDPQIDGPIGASPEQREAAARRIKERLKRLDDDQRLGIMSAIIDQIGASPRELDEHRLLSREELRALDADGSVTFGAHSSTHPILARLPDDRLEAEITRSVEYVRRLKHVSNTFAYPNGRPEDYDRRARAVLEGLGVGGAVTTVRGRCRASGRPFEIPRLVVGGRMAFDAFVVAASGLTNTLRREARAYDA